MERSLALFRRHYIVVLVETLLFAAYFTSFFFLIGVKPIASLYTMVPHVLCNGGLFLLFWKHRTEGPPSMYWSRFDFIVILLFLYLVLCVYYSEVRAISWRVTAMYLDGLSGYFFGRLLFYRRLRIYGFLLVAAVIAAYVVAGTAQTVLMTTDPIRSNQLLQVQRVLVLVGIFWIAALPFLFFHKPGNLAFLTYTAAVLVLYALLVGWRLSWIFEAGQTTTRIEVRHERFETLHTAWRIVRNYPIFGSGLGTFPLLFEAYRASPDVQFTAGFNAYLYSVVEIGLAGAFLILYFLVRLPLHVIRRWRLFPNRRLRMAVFIFLTFSLLVILQGFYDSDIFSPVAWFLIWSNLGIFLSLVMIRDPVRIFETPFYERVLPESAKPTPQQTSAESALRPEMLSIPLAPARGAFAGLPWRHFLPVTGMFVLLTALSLAEAAPYAASKLARLLETEVESDPEYGARLQQAVKIFPIDGKLWKKLGGHYRESAEGPLELYKFKLEIENAFKQAIRHFPYDSDNYSELFYLYRDTNESNSALQTLKNGVSNNPNDFVLRMLLVRELERTGNVAQAIYHTKQALFRISPESVDLYITLAEQYYARGMREQARLYANYARQVVTENVQSNARLRRLQERLTQ